VKKFPSLYLNFRELIFAHETQRALEVIVNLGPGSAGGDSLLGAAQLFVVFPSADVANIFHKVFLLLF
jgi:hypothetical protein